MRHDPAAGAIVIMLRSLKMYGMAQAITDLIEQGAPAFEAAVPILSQLLKAELAEREVRSIAYHMKAARFPAQQLSVEIATQQHMAHSVHLHSESELVKLNMFLQHRLFRNHVRSGCPSLLKAMRQKASPLKTSSLPSSAKSVQAAALATSSNIAVPLYVPFLWKAA